MSDSSSTFVADVGEWGIFTGEQVLASDNGPVSGLPDDVRRDPQFVHVEGLTTPLQFSRVTFEQVPSGNSADLVVVSAYPPFPVAALPDTARRLQAACSTVTLSLVVEDSVGWARATCVDGVSPPSVAAAVAHAKIVGGWDETDPIVVVVNDRTFEVSGRFEGGRWTLTVRQFSEEGRDPS